MAQEVVSLALAEEAATEEAGDAAITAAAFQPVPPFVGPLPAAYAAGTTYAKGALSTEGGKVYRSQAAGNKGNTPSEDATFTHWAPVGVSQVPLQNPNYFHTTVLATPGTPEY